MHTLYRELLLEGAPNPIAMAGSTASLNEVRSALELATIGRHADLLDAAAVVLVAAPRELDAPGDVPGNVVYAGALFEGPGPDADWHPPRDERLVVVATGTVGDALVETDLLQRVLDALEGLPVQGLVNLPPTSIADVSRRPQTWSCPAHPSFRRAAPRPRARHPCRARFGHRGPSLRRAHGVCAPRPGAAGQRTRRRPPRRR
ncbi:MAG: hypothetical protein WKF43_14125 [Acidimicrobiales bacterium]